ncbi:hypothetical protein [Hyphomicrobium sp. LHD-15]|uniref:hypothetical protein n=1 Tax=Hyphomicrobium sp. LHD-15 TaxID=3072142 RepID=UPI0028107314|nr:hypothetical protein [Hyphomicrobium sp. LHD-15]MDQ8699185.1 hypothetical protein [Hyphomicrobium sp. LHD-15]
MRLLRRRQGLRYLALLALAVQFTAVFGHVHAGPVSHARVGLQAHTFFAPASKTCLPGLPEHSDCVICAAINLLGASDLPQPVSMPSMALHLSDVLIGHDVDAMPDLATSSFDARGPPHDRFA